VALITALAEFFFRFGGFLRRGLSIQIIRDDAANQKITKPLHSFASRLARVFIFARSLVNSIRPIRMRDSAGNIIHDFCESFGCFDSALLSRIEGVLQ